MRRANLTATRAELSAAKQTLLKQRLLGKVQRATRWSPVVGIQPSGTRRPLFCVHPVGGTVLCYVELARRLNPAQPFYGLQAAGLDESQPPATSIAEMATHYLAALRQVQPHGPYLLGGWSMGGVVAFEIAQQLHRQGEAATLILIDCMAPVPSNMPVSAVDDEALLLGFAQDLAGRLGKSLPLTRAELQQRGPDAQLEVLISRARSAGVLPSDVDAAQLRRMLQVYKANTQAMMHYEPQPYAHPLILFRAREELHHSQGDRTLGWGTVAQGPVEIAIVSGSHYTLLTPPHVAVLADQLDQVLAAAQER
jgi:thioesterase domain-containing protein